MPELGGGRPAPVLEPRPPEGMGRHTGVGYEVLLNVRVPQMGAQEVERALPAFLQRRKEEEEAAEAERMEEINEKVLAKIPLSSAEKAAWLQWMGLISPSSSSSGAKRRKKRKRRKKKVPKTYSSSSLRFGAVHQGNKLEYAVHQNEDEVTIEYEQRADVLKIHTVVQAKEVAGFFGPVENAPYKIEMNKFVKEKVLRGEEIILKRGKPALNLYGDCTHLYAQSSGKCWLDGRQKSS